MNKNLDKIASRYELCMEMAETIAKNSYNRLKGTIDEPTEIPANMIDVYAQPIHSIAASLFIEMNKNSKSWDEGFGLVPVPEGAVVSEVPNPLWPETLVCRECGKAVSRRESKFNKEINPYYYKCECGKMNYSKGYIPKEK